MVNYKPANDTDFSGLERFVLENKETLNNIGTQVCEAVSLPRCESNMPTSYAVKFPHVHCRRAAKFP